MIPASRPKPASASSLPVVERWFESAPCKHDIVHIRESWIDPFLTGDLWLVRGRDRSLLIDTGTGIVSPRSTVDALTAGPLLALTTNGWYDHAGGLHAFEERACHVEEAAILAMPTAATSVADIYVSDAMLRGLPVEGYTTATYALQGTAVTHTLADGELIDLGDRELRVLHMPGDTAGHIVLFEEATGMLFTGDTLFDDPEPQSRAHYRKPAARADSNANRQRTLNLERIAELPVRTVCAGHFGQFDAGRLAVVLARVMGAAADLHGEFG